MKLLPIWTALASGALLTACASSPSIPPMECVPEPTPQECAQRCPDPPPTTLPRELWELEVLQWGLECKALHDDCVRSDE